VGLLGAVAAEMASAPHAGGVAHHLLLYEALAHLRGDERTAGQLPPDRLDEIATLANFVRRLVDLESYLASDATSARVRLFVADADYAKGVLMREWLAARLPIRLEGSGVQYHMSGDLPVALEVVDAIVHDQLRSLGWTSAAVTLLLALALRSVRLAALAVVPAAAAIGAVLGAMGAAGIPLGIATSMFAALAIGLGVDFVVHLMHAVRRERLRGLDGDVAARNALAGSRGVGWSAVSLAGGFAVLALSSLPPNHLLGLLLAAATLACWGLSRLWFPFLVRGVEARERRPGRRCARPVGRPGADRA
jgi:predicted RND superfamily exporter protein